MVASVSRMRYLKATIDHFSSDAVYMGEERGLTVAFGRAAMIGGIILILQCMRSRERTYQLIRRQHICRYRGICACIRSLVLSSANLADASTPAIDGSNGSQLILATLLKFYNVNWSWIHIRAGFAVVS